MALKDLAPDQQAEAKRLGIDPLNGEVSFSGKASSFHGENSTGLLLIGDNGIEYYNSKKVKDFIQIPWAEVSYVAASVWFGRYITRFAVFTRMNGHFDFSARDNKAALRAMRGHVADDKLQRSLGFFKVVGRGFKGLFNRIFKR